MSGSTGGRADKLGNRYEGLWVASQLLHLLAERVAAVQLEALGDDERGVDVWVTRADGTRDAQQCKRKNRTTGKWGIRELGSQGILGHLATQLRRDPTVRYTLVSAHPAPEFRELADMSRRADAAEAYFRDTLAVAIHAEQLRRFCQEVGVDPVDAGGRQLVFDLLRRSFTHLFEDSPEGHGAVAVLSRCLIDGEPDNAIEVLANFAEDRLGEVLTIEQVRRHLRDRGLPPTNIVGHPQLITQVERLREEFRQSLQPSLIHSAPVPRPEAAAVRDLLTGQTDRRLVVLHGRSGTGKSYVLLQLADLLDREGIPYLPLRLDRRTPRTSSRRYGIDGCGLAESPAVVLHSLNPGRRTVLIVDQLDAVRWTASHASAPWEACRQVLDDALALPDMAVVVACRTFDLRDDQQIRAWHTFRQGHEVVVGDLKDDSVAAVVAAGGGDHAKLTPRQKALLRSPLHLALWIQAAEGDQRPAGEWATQADLLRAFWRSRFEMAERMSVPLAEVRNAVAALVAEMDRRGRLTAPARILETYPRAADALRSLHVVDEVDGRLTFAHQSYFEYRLAARLLDEAQGGGRPVADWVQAGDQSLLRRDPLRLVLTLLRDEDHGEYVRTLRDLILAPVGAVRFHLRQLALRILGEAAGPTPLECELVCELAGNPAWREHALDQVFTRQPAWLDAADDRGLIIRWLASADEKEINLGLVICRWWSGQRGDRVAGLVGVYLSHPDPWPRRIAGVLPFNPAEDTLALFRLRLSLVRDGVVQHSHLMAKELAERCPERLVDLLDAHLDRRQANPEEPADTPAHERGFPYFLPYHEIEHLERAADALPLAFWERLMPHVVRTCERTRQDDNEQHPTPFFQDSTWPPERYPSNEPNVELLRLVARAGARVVGIDPAGFATRHAGWLDNAGQSVQRTVGLALADAPEAVADLAVGWLCNNPHRLSLPDERGHHWGIAQRLIGRHAAACSPAAYTRLERTILGYHEADERRNMEWQLQAVREGWLRANDYGLSQHALLPCLPDNRVSDTARSEIGVLNCKFGRPAAERDVDRRGRIRRIVGPFAPGRSARIPDRGWLRIITGVNRVLGHRDIDADTVADNGSEAFARSFGDQAQWEPGRFARLALAIPTGANSAYLAGVLHAAAATSPPNTECADWQPASDDEVRALVEHVGYQEDERVATGMCWLMRQRPASLSTPQCLNLLCRYATNHPHPAANWALSSNRKLDYDTESLNCVRGRAVGAIGQLLFAEPCLAGVFEPALCRAARDAHPAVLVAVVGACLSILQPNRKLAVELFLTTCTGPDEVLASRWVNEFIRYSLWSHHQELGPLLRRMAGSSVSAVATVGATWLTVGSLKGRFPQDEIDRLAGGTPDQRAGVARAAAHNCDDQTHLTRCVELLSRLIDDPDEQVHKQASKFIRHGVVMRSPDGRRLLAALVVSREFGRNPSSLVEALRQYTDSLVPLAPVLEAVCVRVAGDLADPIRRGQIQGGYALDRFVPLILRLYEQAEQASDARLRAACLNWWDQLLEARMGGTAQILGELDAESRTDL